jgi:signal peptidase I
VRSISHRQLAGTVLGATVVVALALAAVTLIAFGVQVVGPSMSPTLGEGDDLLLAPFSSGALPPRFAIVALRFSARGPLAIKRVIGLPGDRIEIVRTGARSDASVRVQPDGAGPWESIADPAWRGRWGDIATACCTRAGETSARPRARRVPAGDVFVLGEDPGVSADSRTYGWVPVKRIDGRVWLRLTPIGEFGTVGQTASLHRVAESGAKPVSAHRARVAAG